jgi:hypothetical protein
LAKYVQRTLMDYWKSQTKEGIKEQVIQGKGIKATRN